jgi:dienelactone hydrolase
MGARDYRLLLEEIASHGYVIAAVNPLGSPPVSEARYSDAADELVDAATKLRALSATPPTADLIDPSRVGFLGHSIGGGAAVLALSRDPGALAAINLDGDFGGASDARAPQKPILYVVGRTDGERQASRDRRGAVWKTMTTGNAQAVALQIETLRHFDFADAALLPPDAMSDERRRNRFGPIGGSRAHTATSKLILGFLDQALSAGPSTLDAAMTETPEAKPAVAF